MRFLVLSLLWLPACGSDALCGRPFGCEADQYCQKMVREGEPDLFLCLAAPERCEGVPTCECMYVPEDCRIVDGRVVGTYVAD